MWIDEAPLQLDQQVEEDLVAARGVGDEAGDLPEVRLLLARGRAERGESTAPIRSARMRKPPWPSSSRASCWIALEILGALDEDVGDGEGVVEGQRGVVTAEPNLLGPDPARNVDEEAAAVALAVDVARPGGASSAGPGSPARSARGWASRPSD